MFGLTTFAAVLATIVVYSPKVAGVECMLAIPTSGRAMIIDNALRAKPDSRTRIKRLLNPLISLVVVIVVVPVTTATRPGPGERESPPALPRLFRAFAFS